MISKSNLRLFICYLWICCKFGEFSDHGWLTGSISWVVSLGKILNISSYQNKIRRAPFLKSQYVFQLKLLTITLVILLYSVVPIAMGLGLVRFYFFVLGIRIKLHLFDFNYHMEMEIVQHYVTHTYCQALSTKKWVPSLMTIFIAYNSKTIFNY